MHGPSIRLNTASGDTCSSWPVSWTAVWVGALAALAATLVFGLVAIAIGANVVGTGGHVVRWHDVTLGTLIASVFGAFLAFVIGGWCTGKVAGLRRAEPMILHGAITWLIAVPVIVVLVALSGGAAFGGWYGGLAGPPAWQTVIQNASANPDAARIARNGALTAITALLLGLIGAVIGAWLASGEPMTLVAERHRLERTGAMRSASAGPAAR